MNSHISYVPHIHTIQHTLLSPTAQHTYTTYTVSIHTILCRYTCRYDITQDTTHSAIALKCRLRTSQRVVTKSGIEHRMAN